MKFLRDALEGLKSFGRRETWHQIGKGIGMFADSDKRQKIFQQAKEGVDDAKAGKLLATSSSLLPRLQSGRLPTKLWKAWRREITGKPSMPLEVKLKADRQIIKNVYRVGSVYDPKVRAGHS